jgi:hypothetical protein
LTAKNDAQRAEESTRMFVEASQAPAVVADCSDRWCGAEFQPMAKVGYPLLNRRCRTARLALLLTFGGPNAMAT